MAETKGGLDGVVVADTSLSLVDGEAGRLILVGHEIESLAGGVPFEDVCHLLWEERPAGQDRRGPCSLSGR